MIVLDISHLHIPIFDYEIRKKMHLQDEGCVFNINICKVDGIILGLKLEMQLYYC